MESNITMTFDRGCAVPAVASGIAAGQRGTGLSLAAQGSKVRPHSTDGVVPGLDVWSPMA